ncbi:MAG: hypothetical protein R3D52_08925 [Xanthobacteraceae bacterium]
MAALERRPGLCFDMRLCLGDAGGEFCVRHIPNHRGVEFRVTAIPKNRRPVGLRRKPGITFGDSVVNPSVHVPKRPERRTADLRLFWEFASGNHGVNL